MRFQRQLFLMAFFCWIAACLSFSQAQDGIPIDPDANFATSVTITNYRSCVDPDKPPLQQSCFKESTDFDKQACPAGWCLTRYDGCTRVAYGEEPTKFFQFEQISTEDVQTPSSATANSPRKKKAKQIGDPIECYRKRPCTCERNGDGQPGECEAGEWKTYALAKYEVLNEDCPVAVSIGLED